MATKRRKRRAVKSTAAKLALAPLVIAHRLPILAAEAAKSPFGGRETRKAASEKLAAATEGALAAQREAGATLVRFWLGALMGTKPSPGQMSRAAGRVVDAALAPAGKRVSANAKRLSRPGK